jgi:hypothetical protein
MGQYSEYAKLPFNVCFVQRDENLMPHKRVGFESLVRIETKSFIDDDFAERNFITLHFSFLNGFAYNYDIITSVGDFNSKDCNDTDLRKVKVYLIDKHQPDFQFLIENIKEARVETIAGERWEKRVELELYEF